MNVHIPEKVAGAITSRETGLNKPGVGVTGRPEIPVKRMAALAKMAQAACRRNTPEGSLEDFRILPPREKAQLTDPHQTPVPIAVAVKNSNAVPNLETALPEQSCEQPEDVTLAELGGLVLARLKEMDTGAVVDAAKGARREIREIREIKILEGSVLT